MGVTWILVHLITNHFKQTRQLLIIFNLALRSFSCWCGVFLLTCPRWLGQNFADPIKDILIGIHLLIPCKEKKQKYPSSPPHLQSHANLTFTSLTSQPYSSLPHHAIYLWNINAPFPLHVKCVSPSTLWRDETAPFNLQPSRFHLHASCFSNLCVCTSILSPTKPHALTTNCGGLKYVHKGTWYITKKNTDVSCGAVFGTCTSFTCLESLDLSLNNYKFFVVVVVV